jgi:hypothetical protein
LTLVLCLLAWAPADAQPASTARVTRTVGNVQALKKGQSQWVPVGVGQQYSEGDQIRAYAASLADLALPDGSTILVSENTRFVVTKMNYDPRTRDRLIAFHVVIGKLKAEVVRTAVQVVRARQSNFLISGPSGVAAVRGTVVVYIVTDTQTLVAVFPSPGETDAQAATAVTTPGGQVVVPGGQFTVFSGTGAPSTPVSITTLTPEAQQNLLTAFGVAQSNGLNAIQINVTDITQFLTTILPPQDATPPAQPVTATPSG